MVETIDPIKAMAKKKRIIMELAGKIHDVVEDSLWQDYPKLSELSAELIVLIDELNQFQKTHAL
jgi:hypothetical protein